VSESIPVGGFFVKKLVVSCVMMVMPGVLLASYTEAAEIKYSPTDIKYQYPNEVTDETFQREILRAQGVSDKEIDTVQKKTRVKKSSVEEELLNAEKVIKKLMPGEHFTLDHAAVYLAKVKEALSIMENLVGVRDPGYERAQKYFELVLGQRRKHVTFSDNVYDLPDHEMSNEEARKQALRSQGVSDKEIDAAHKKSCLKQGREQEELSNAKRVIAMLLPDEIFTLEHVELYLKTVKDARKVIDSLGINASEHERAQSYFECILKQKKERNR